MNFLYINAIVNETYLTANCACPFPENTQSEVSTYSIQDDVLKTNVPGILTYFTVKQKAEAPLPVLSRTQRHQNTGSVGRFIQSLGWAWSDKLLLNGMDDILSATFYTEAEIDTMVKSGTPIPLPSEGQSAASYPIADLREDVKTAILSALMLRWLRNEPAIRIAVPKAADYNTYVSSAVKIIYRLLPMALRAEAGFCSYTPDLRAIISRVYIGFIPEELSDSNTMFLDGSNQAAINRYTKSTGRPALDTLIAYLAKLPTGQLQAFLQDLFTEVEKDALDQGTFTAKDYQPTGAMLQLLNQNGDPAVQIPQWIEALREPDKYPPAMQRRLTEHISRCLSAEILCSHFLDTCKNASDAESVCESLAIHQCLVRNNPTLTNALLDAFAQALRQGNFTALAVCESVFRKKEQLSPLVDKDMLNTLFTAAMAEKFQALTKLPAETPQDIEKQQEGCRQLLNALRQQGIADADLIPQISDYAESLDRQSAELVYQKYKKLLTHWLEEPDITMPQLRKIISALDTLILQMEKETPSAQLKDLIELTGQKLSEKKAKMDSADTQYDLFSQKMRSLSYFEAVQLLAHPDFVKLDKGLRDNLTWELKQYAPLSYGEYVQAFTDHYHKALILETLISLAPAVCHWILRDICDFKQLTIPFTENSSVEDFSREVSHLFYLAGHICPDTTVCVTLQKKLLPAQEFVSLLLLTGDAKALPAFSITETPDIAVTLMQYGVYRENEKAAGILFDLFQAKRWNMQPLAKAALQGAFSMGDHKQYEKFFAAVMDTCSGEEKHQLYKALEAFYKDKGTEKPKAAQRGFVSATRKLAARIERQEKQDAKRQKAEESRSGPR